jgi:hypothetical protein
MTRSLGFYELRDWLLANLPADPAERYMTLRVLNEPDVERIQSEEWIERQLAYAEREFKS